MYGVYKIYNNDDLIYIGKTNNFYTRIKTHLAQQPWKDKITHIAIAKCKTKVDMDLYEKYYINKLNPKYNKAIVYNEIPTFAVEELNFEKFELNNFLNMNKSQNLKSSNSNKRYEKRKQEIHELLQTSIEIKTDQNIDFLNTSHILYHWSNLSKTNINFLHVNGDIVFFKQILKGIKDNTCEELDDKYVFVFENREDIFKNFNKYSLGLRIDSYSISEKRISKGFSGINLVSGMYLNPRTKNVTVKINKYMMNEYFNRYFIY
jgi:excinuclease UvrABC nuclease subunit